MTRTQQYAVGALVVAAVGIPVLRSVAGQAGSTLNLTPIQVAIVLAAGSALVAEVIRS